MQLIVGPGGNEFILQHNFLDIDGVTFDICGMRHVSAVRRTVLPDHLTQFTALAATQSSVVYWEMMWHIALDLGATQ